ncbi:hypothetical protein [Legionella sp. PC997]|uniref:hypothetical protein n=1 Tax=Legionella sp. PC997 TaxID=2755562 RepID=UPI0015FC85F2|nr:hypothetical protein [Legionella sp. PC997]QMT60267.1 hypothetical protein HBNCFIEN_01639 [Legionella sp. PC997]
MPYTLPSQPMPRMLNSHQLEQWFATIERDNTPNTTETDSHLSTQFLARFGLREATQVVEFLKTAGGNETINMIAQELMKEEEQTLLIRKSSEEELLRQQRLLFLLMTLIAKNKAHTEHVNEMTQHQIDERLNEFKSEEKKHSSIAMHLMDASIRASKIIKLDEELTKLESDLTQLEEELQELEEEVLAMEEYHADMADHLEQLNEFLQIPLLNNQPITQYVSHANQQITALSTQLATLRAQQTAQVPNNIDRIQETNRQRLERRARLLEEQLAFYQSQLQHPPQTSEEVYQQLIAQIRTRLNEQESLSEDLQLPTYREGLRLQERGLIQALQFLRKEKILLNSQLEPVNDFSQAQFIIDPNQRARYRRHGDSYVVFSEKMDPDHASEKDLLKAKLKYDKLKSDICTVNYLYNNRMQNQAETLRTRSQVCQSRVQKVMNRIDNFQENKVQLLQAQTPFAMSPKPTAPRPQPRSSYSRMLKCLVPTHAPAPRPEDILKAKNVLEAVIKPERKYELNELIGEVKPGEIMSPETRLGWLYRVKKLIPDLPVPELDSSSKHQKK